MGCANYQHMAALYYCFGSTAQWHIYPIRFTNQEGATNHPSDRLVLRHTRNGTSIRCIYLTLHWETKHKVCPGRLSPRSSESNCYRCRDRHNSQAISTRPLSESSAFTILRKGTAEINSSRNNLGIFGLSALVLHFHSILAVIWVQSQR